MKRILFVMLVLCLSVTTLVRAELPAATSGLEKVRLQLKWHHQFQFAGYYAALEQGYYQEAGLEVELLERTQGQKRTVELLLSGQADYAIDGANVLVGRIQGQPLVALAAIFQHSPSVAIGLQKNNLNTAKDMVGRRMMTYGADQEIPAMLLQEGIDPAKIELLPSSYRIESLTEDETDFFSGYITNEPFFLEQKQVAYSIINPLNYGIDFYGDILFTSEKELIEHPQRAAAFRTASIKGWQYAVAHPEEIVELILTRYSQKKSREHLLYEARESIKLIAADVVEIGHINPGRFDQMAKVLKELGQVQITEGLEGFVYEENPIGQLSAAELAWLARHKKIRVYYGHYPPLFYDFGKGPVTGLIVDYLQKLNDDYGIEIEYVNSLWDPALAGIGSEQGPDVISVLRPTLERSKQMVFSQPYLNLHAVIYSRDQEHDIGGVEDLAGRKVSLQRGVLAAELVKKQYPLVEIVYVDSDLAGLTMLASGQVDAYVGNLLGCNSIIAERGYANIKVAAPFTLLTPEHVLGVRKDWPELVSLFDRSLSRISPAEQAAMRSHWLSSVYEPGWVPEDVLRWVGLGLVVVLFGFGLFTLWTRSLQKQISRRKLSEEALSESVQQYQVLLQAIPHGVIELDQELKIIYCNQPFSQLVGYDCRALYGKSIAELIGDEEILAKLIREIETIHQQPAGISIKLAIADHQGQRHQVQFDLHPSKEIAVDHQVIFVTDLTHQARVEKALLETEAFYSTTFDRIQAGILHLDMQGKFVRVNPYLCELLGYSEPELLALPLDQITHPEDRDISREMLQQLKTKKTEPFTVAKRYLKKDGSSIWGLVTASMQAIHSGGDVYVCVVQNIDDFKQQQDQVTETAQNLELIIQERTLELQQRFDEVAQLNSAMLNLAGDLQQSNNDLALQQEQLAAANAELEAFSYSVSHDLRAPLRHISGFVAILQQSSAAQLEPSALSLLERIAIAAEKMGQMIDDLLSFSRAGRADLIMAPVDMRLLFKEVSADIDQDYAESKIDWKIADVPSVYGDVSILRQVVVNLLDNAAKYSAKTAQPRVEVSALLEDGEVVFKISDNGVGFDQTYADKLFRVFQRLHREEDFSGTGIGLATVRRIVMRHGGWVKGESQPGQGACFSFSLPDGKGRLL